MTNCLMPKLVGTQLIVRTLTQITLVLLPYSHRKENDSFLQKILSLIFCLDPQHFLLILWIFIFMLKELKRLKS
jgi:hypothetical protein